MIVTPTHEIPLAVRRKAVAVHEAGHALAATLLQRKVIEAVLQPPHGLSGETRFESTPGGMLDLSIEADRRAIADAIVVLLAGQVAEAEYWKTQTHLYTPVVTSHRSDDAEVRKLRSELAFSPEHGAMFIGYCMERTRRIVLHASAQAAIEEIATTLFGTLSISGGELIEIALRHDVMQEKSASPSHPWQRRR